MNSNIINQFISINMKQRIPFLFLTISSFFLCLRLCAQTESIGWQRVNRDSIPAGLDSLLTAPMNPQPTDDVYRVVTNRFRHNLFVYGDFGVHTFQGDWSGNGKFSKTLSPDFTIGIGKWFTPGFGIKAQMGMGASKGFTEIWTPYAVGHQNAPLLAHDGTPYWKLKTRWWDFSANVTFNISRILYAWEGYGSDKRFNQFFLTLGIGGVHHYDKALKDETWGEPYAGPKNEWYGNVELQYSRFFNTNKAWSLDVKLRGKFYETHFDLSPIAGRRWDFNTGISIGATYYIKQRGWERCSPCNEASYYIHMPAPVAIPRKCPEYKTFTFYVFYPNNYSGRNDAPVIEDATVNSMDYLAGGIFAQKRFEDNTVASLCLKGSTPLHQFPIVNIPTEKATFVENPSGVARGYEISTTPISLSMNPDSLRRFESVMGYYYAPIYENGKTWHYRIDDETRTQVLLGTENYKESTSYGLNAHAGLNIVKESMPVEQDSQLYSFADVYAAIEGNEGYISRYTDKKAVSTIQNILKNGRILRVDAEGLATSQDNWTGKDAETVGLTRNKALSYNRALSVIKWLQNCGKFEGVAKENFSINALSEPIGIVNDTSTRGLKAKLNRCARIRIQYIE